jgi:hypothetical protein
MTTIDTVLRSTVDRGFDTVDIDTTSVRTRVAAVGLLFTSTAFVYVAGASGMASAVLLAACWLLLPMVYVVAIGHVLLVAITMDGLAVVDALLAELGLLVLLLASVQDSYRPRTSLAVTTVALVGLLVAVGVTLAVTESLLIVAVVFAGTGMVTVYGLHRYELSVLERMEGSA